VFAVLVFASSRVRNLAWFLFDNPVLVGYTGIVRTKVKTKEKNMTINLHDLTGQESGIILVETDDGRHMNMVANWGANDGLPYLFEPMLEPFSFLFLPSEDVHVETERIHSGALNDEIAHDGLEDWNPLDDDLESDEPCEVYPLSNGWTVVAPKNWN
jgi:hypothetical protein